MNRISTHLNGLAVYLTKKGFGIWWLTHQLILPNGICAALPVSWFHAKSLTINASSKLSMRRSLVTPGDWKYIYIATYFQSPGVISTDCFSLCRLQTENPNFGELGVTDLDQTYFIETRMLGLSNNTKIVSIGWNVWSQITSLSDGWTHCYSVRTNRERSSQKWLKGD